MYLSRQAWLILGVICVIRLRKSLRRDRFCVICGYFLKSAVLCLKPQFAERADKSAALGALSLGAMAAD
jgi:hypothetical protein